MNVVFWVLVLVAIILIWFVASSIFTPIGSFIHKIVSHIKNVTSDSPEAVHEEEKEGKRN